MKLAKLGQIAADNYYNKANSVISDDLYESISDIREVNYDKHYVPMLSIGKKEIKFTKRVITPKLDGVSLELIYKRDSASGFASGSGSASGSVGFSCVQLDLVAFSCFQLLSTVIY